MRRARVEIRSADTGSWSLYQPGVASDIGYHKVLRDFTRGLCSRLNLDRQRAAIALRERRKDPGAVLTAFDRYPDAGAVLHRPAALQPLPVRAAEGARPARPLGLSGGERRILAAVAPRTILYTGKGGVGKTSVAAATARRLRGRGAAHPARLDRPGPQPRRRPRRDRGLAAHPGVARTSTSQQVSAQDELDRHWSEVQDWLGDLLVRKGVDRIAAEELTVLPGMDELFGLLEIGRHYDDGFYDVDRRRLRADGRDAAAAVVPGRRALVARQGVPAAEPDGRGRAPVLARAAVRGRDRRRAARRPRRSSR